MTTLTSKTGPLVLHSKTCRYGKSSSGGRILCRKIHFRCRKGRLRLGLVQPHMISPNIIVQRIRIRTAMITHLSRSIKLVGVRLCRRGFWERPVAGSSRNLARWVGLGMWSKELILRWLICRKVRSLYIRLSFKGSKWLMSRRRWSGRSLRNLTSRKECSRGFKSSSLGMSAVCFVIYS